MCFKASHKIILQNVKDAIGRFKTLNFPLGYNQFTSTKPHSANKLCLMFLLTYEKKVFCLNFTVNLRKANKLGSDFTNVTRTILLSSGSLKTFKS